MTLKTSLTGSYPPMYNPDKTIRFRPQEEQESEVCRSIERAIQDQIKIGIDILVDGQVRDDIVSIFASRLPGYAGQALPYHAIARIRPADEPITVQDYQYAREYALKLDQDSEHDLAADRPLKAHITGPMTMARATRVDTSDYTDMHDPKLIMDIARALGQEARFLVQAGAEIVQIDEPVLVDGVDLDLAFKAMKQIVEIGEIPFPGLHICGNVSLILDQVLTSAPVKMISLEGDWLKRAELNYVNRDYLTHCGKQIGLGCIKASDHTLEKITPVKMFLGQMIAKLGEEHIWAVTPNCGLRFVPDTVVQQKLLVLVEAVKSL